MATGDWRLAMTAAAQHKKFRNFGYWAGERGLQCSGSGAGQDKQ
jgi:hypothetical protein